MISPPCNTLQFPTLSNARRPLLLSSCVFPEDERSETVCTAIIETIKEKAALLDQWRSHHEKLYGANAEHDIPVSAEMHLSKMKGGLVNADTCNSARLTSAMLCDAIEDAVEEERISHGVNEDDDLTQPIVLRMDCHHHLRNVWIGALNKHLSKYLDNILQQDLTKISFRYRVSTMMDSVLRAVDKEFSLPANYPKGHGDHFKLWMEENHPGALLVPVERSSGSRQDLAVEGAAAIYWNRR